MLADTSSAGRKEKLRNARLCNNDKNTVYLSRHSSFMIMHIFADWAEYSIIGRKALELLRVRLLRLMDGIGIKSKVWGEILSSKGLLRGCI